MSHDRPGCCVICHKNMLRDRTVGGKVLRVFDGDYRVMNYILNDGSNMRVVICEADLIKYEGLSVKDKEEVDKEVMGRVYAGWEYETQLLVANKDKPQWDDKKKKEYLEKYKGLRIVTCTDKLDPEVVERKYRAHLKKSRG